MTDLPTLFRASRRAFALAALLVCAVASAAAAAPERTAGGIRFTYLDPNAKSVSWAGVFNGWNPSANPLRKGEGGVWSVIVALPPGEHEYKFVVDGTWTADPENPVTRGDFGNSFVVVGADGNLVATAMQATSNTAYSPKILMGGRAVGDYRLVRNADAKRFELQSPQFDIGLNLDVRISDVMKARVLLSTQPRATGTNQLFQSPLELERGWIEFRGNRLTILAYDNEGVDRWDDPLHLLGTVGIYGYRFGYDRQGFKITSQKLGFDTEIHYADNFRTGATSYPGVTTTIGPTSIATRWDGTQYVFAPGALAYNRNTVVSDANENTFAMRVRRALGHGVTAGVLARNDRGFDLTSAAFLEPVGPTRFSVTSGNYDQEWWGAGGELHWNAPHGFEAHAELLGGVRRLNAVTTVLSAEADATLDSTGITGVGALEPSNAAARDHDLDHSTRFHLGGAWTESHGDIRVAASVQRETHDYEIVQDGLENAMTVWRLSWDRNWRYYLNREVKTGLAIERTDFDYDASTPWSYQLWFPDGNFWLEHGEHVVSFDRLTLLGGDDVLTVRPSLEVPVARRRNVKFAWRGTYDLRSLSKLPKYAENVFVVGLDVNSRTRLTSDTRWAKYDDPVLQLHSGYACNYTQLQYTFGPGITFALGYGLDPNVVYKLGVDEDTRIGRDAFLFGLDANAVTAQNDYFGLGAAIASAERALRDYRGIQLRGIVTF